MNSKQAQQLRTGDIVVFPCGTRSMVKRKVREGDRFVRIHWTTGGSNQFRGDTTLTVA